MNTETIETILVVVIVLIQIIVFLRTYRQIRVFQNIIPDTSSVTVSRILVPVREIENNLSGDLLLENSFDRVAIPDRERGEEGVLK
jgi:hypothetical protein